MRRDREPLVVHPGGFRAIVLLEPRFSNRPRSIVESPKLDLADPGHLHIALTFSAQAILDQNAFPRMCL